ncbi:MAG TPA: YwiC-like family protein [Bryobacteraceae bacterium]|nr:YwiC-like family protein [Bryobacteraceae bacterium]
MATATLGHQSGQTSQTSSQSYVPREHGATAMALTPFVVAAILQRQVYWQELVALLAVVVALIIKDPLVVIARQRWVWKQEHPETAAARRTAAVELLLLLACAIPLVLTRDWRWLSVLFLTSGAFTALAVAVNVRNRQRAVWFQVLSAIALTGTSVAACLAGIGTVPGWCWVVWALCAVQAAAGIFVVHARLDARIAARKSERPSDGNRRAAFLFQIVLLVGTAVSAVFGHWFLAAALGIAALGYLLDLRRQRDPASLQMPLKHVGQQALALSITFALLLIAGLW